MRAISGLAQSAIVCLGLCAGLVCLYVSPSKAEETTGSIGAVESFYGKTTEGAAANATRPPAALDGDIPASGAPRMSGAILRDIQEKGFATVYIQFDFDRDSIADESREQVSAIYEVLRSQPGLCLRIDGHTDSTGDKNYNLDLSQRRAEAIKAAMVQSGATETRLQAKGYGAENPVADNSTAGGRAQNRRVELHRVQCE